MSSLYLQSYIKSRFLSKSLVRVPADRRGTLGGLEGVSCAAS